MKINERSLVEGLSYALDVAEKSYFSHSKHVGYISFMLGIELGMSKEDQKDLYFTALLHDIGSSNAYNVREHCEIGREILLKLPVNPVMAEYIYYHHEFYNGAGEFKLIGDDIPLISQIICLADLFEKNFCDLKSINFDSMQIIQKWINTHKELFNPKLVEAFCELIDKEYVLLNYFNSEFNYILSKAVNIKGCDLDYDGVKAYADAFSKIIDNRSHFTYTHSNGIANLVNKMTLELGYDVDTQNKMNIAALLHDVGKLVISNDIIEKPGKLDEVERFEINKHTYYTRWILSQIEGFEDITNYAANHHEKLTGKGYPLQLKANQIGDLERIMAICDIFQALTEDRPYRQTMPKEKVWAIIDSMVEKGELDGVLVGKAKNIL